MHRLDPARDRVDPREHAVEARAPLAPGIAEAARGRARGRPALDIARELGRGGTLPGRGELRDLAGRPHDRRIERRRGTAERRRDRRSVPAARHRESDRGERAGRGADRDDRQPAVARRLLGELCEQRVHRRPAPRRIGIEPALQRVARALGQPRELFCRDAALDLGAQRDRALAAKRPLVRERLPQRDAVRELIARRPDDAAPLLRRHVRGCAEHRARARDAGHRARRRIVAGRRLVLGRRRHRIGLDVDAAREPEVRYHDAAIARAQHVVRLEVAMHEPGRVRGGEPATRLREHVEDRAGIARRAAQPFVDRRTLDELHRDVVAPARRADLVHDDHVRVREPRHRPRLAQQARARFIAARGAAQHLQRDAALEIGIERGVHDAHPADPELALEAIATEHRAERRDLDHRGARRRDGARQLVVDTHAGRIAHAGLAGRICGTCRLRGIRGSARAWSRAVRRGTRVAIGPIRPRRSIC